MDAKSLLNTALGISMLGVAMLAGGGINLLWRQKDRKRGTLMLVAALVLFCNVLIWAWPT